MEGLGLDFSYLKFGVKDGFGVRVNVMLRATFRIMVKFRTRARARVSIRVIV